MKHEEGTTLASGLADPSALGRRWLALAGPVSSYTWELFGRISQQSGVRLEVFHNPPDERQIRATYAHESFRSGGATAHDWGRMTPGQLLHSMNTADADAILLFGTRSKLALIQALVRRSPRCPVVFVADTNVADVFPEGPRGWARLLFYRAIAPFVTEAWTLGRSNEQAFRLLGFRKLRTLPFYAVDYDELGAPRAEPLDPASGRFHLLAIARLSPEKNIESLIRAVDRDELRQRVDLTIVGDGPERAHLEQLAVRLPAARVRLVGAVAHAALGAYLASAHALVLPSRYEPWGNVVTEALGMGLPVLATPAVGAATSSAGRYGGIRIADGSDDVAIAAGLTAFIGHYAAVAMSARDEAWRVRAEFDVGSVAGRMIEAIKELRAASAARPPG